MKLVATLSAALLLSSCSNGIFKYIQESTNESVVTAQTAEPGAQEESAPEVSYPSYEYIRENGVSGFDQYFNNPDVKEQYYNEALTLIEQGQRDKGINILQALANNFPDYKQVQSLLDILEAPFSTSAIVVERHIQNYLRAPSLIPAFDIQKPPVPKLPEKPIMTRGEFETSVSFKQRVNQAQKKYANDAEAIINEYKRNVNVYNQAVRDYNKQIVWEKRSRLEKVPSMRKRYMDIALSEALGNPTISDLNYIADKKQFIATLKSSNNNLTTQVKIDVPLGDAKTFKENYQKVKPLIKIDILGDKIIFSKLDFAYNNTIYTGSLLDREILEKFDIVKVQDTDVEAVVESTEREALVLETIEFYPEEIVFESVIDINDVLLDKEFTFTND